MSLRDNMYADSPTMQIPQRYAEDVPDMLEGHGPCAWQPWCSASPCVRCNPRSKWDARACTPTASDGKVVVCLFWRVVPGVWYATMITVGDCLILTVACTMYNVGVLHMKSSMHLHTGTMPSEDGRSGICTWHDDGRRKLSERAL